MLAAFDLDNTLLDRSAAIRRWAELLVEHEGLASREIDTVVRADADGSTSREDFLVQVELLPGMHMGGSELRRWYDVSYSACYVPDEESIRALTMFRDAGWKVGVVTNGRKRRTEEKLINARLAPLVDGLCVAEEVGAEKPSRRIFEETARRCGSVLSGWMIGDAPTEDIAGGAGAGLCTAWVRRGRTWGTVTPRPDMEVDSVLEAALRILEQPVDSSST